MADIIGKIEQIARMADLHFQRNGDYLMLSFDLGQGRDQTIGVGPLEETFDGMNVILFFSPCQRLSKGLMGGLSKSDAVNLLRYNAHLPFGHFCIMEIDGHETVCVRATQLLETMEVQEFRANCQGVATVADGWEQRIGKNEY